MRILLVLLAAIVPSFVAIKCHHSLRNGAFNHTFDDCQGDICYLLKDDENGLLIQGCVQGIPYLSQRFQHLDSKWAWLCDSDLCNDNLPSVAIAAISSAATSTCLANATSGAYCKASKCWYQLEKLLIQPGITAIDERSSCKSFTGNPSYRMMFGQLTEVLMPNACYHTLNDMDAAGEMLGQTVCSCTGDYCNRQPNYNTTLRAAIKLVTCRMSPQTAQSDVDIGATCKGQYCYLQRATINGYDIPIEFYTKGCFNATGTRDYLDIGYRRFDQATNSEETWVCDWDDCNQSLNEAAKAKRTATTTQTNDSILTRETISSPAVSSATDESLAISSEAFTANPKVSTLLPADTSSTESAIFHGTLPFAPFDQTSAGEIPSTSEITIKDLPTGSPDLSASSAAPIEETTESLSTSNVSSNDTISEADEITRATTAKSCPRVSFTLSTSSMPIIIICYSLLS